MAVRIRLVESAGSDEDQLAWLVELVQRYAPPNIPCDILETRAGKTVRFTVAGKEYNCEDVGGMVSIDGGEALDCLQAFRALFGIKKHAIGDFKLKEVESYDIVDVSVNPPKFECDCSALFTIDGIGDTAADIPVNVIVAGEVTSDTGADVADLDAELDSITGLLKMYNSGNVQGTDDVVDLLCILGLDMDDWDDLRKWLESSAADMLCNNRAFMRELENAVWNEAYDY